MDLVHNNIFANIGMFPQDDDDNEAGNLIFHQENMKQSYSFMTAMSNNFAIDETGFIHL